MYGLNGRKALVTGAASGIGRRIATRLAEEGCDVGILDVDAAGARGTAAEVERLGRAALVMEADVGEPRQLKEALAAFEGRFGEVDILVNNAAITTMGRIGEIRIEDWRRVFQINVEGVFSLCSLLAPRFAARRSGRIVNTASWFGKIGKSHYGAYCASKFAVIGLTQSLAAELAPFGVTVNAVCPGTIVETGMREVADRRAVESGLKTAKQREAEIPLGRVGLPDDIARVVAFLASDEASYMTGQSINVTGGLWMH
ncbi:SDR family NAD(P)-dependent oxidoreductase [Chelatococcus sp. GCM10030263]|uniref:SDR family NAD(P)-dependent oxidoreductase n=1 Tax=Chelatococcus sp. GCM10030263 TaxID=3273387 RepID=UPI0036073F48